MSDIILVKLESTGSETHARGLYPPFGILYLADSLEKAGFSVNLVHEEGTKANIQALVDLISTEKPFLVGFSVMTGPQIIPSLEASKEIKKRHDVPIVFGGIQPTVLSELVIAKTFIDFLAIGEGEETIVELAQSLSKHGMKNSELEKVAGIAFKKNGACKVNEPRPFIKDLDSINAAWHHLDIERYVGASMYFAAGLGGQRTMTVNTSRGCPWRCGFCYNQSFNNRAFRAQSPARVVREIQNLKEQYGATGIRFTEDYFFSDKRRGLEIIREVGIPWTATMRANDLAEGGDDLAAELAENHCAVLRIGVESGSQRVLDMIRKDISLDQARKSAKLCSKNGITAGFFCILGFPGESWTDICATLDFIDELEGISEHVIVQVPHIFCPLPGTPLLDTAVEMGFKPPTSLEGWGTTMENVVKNTGSLPPYVDRRVERIIDYLRLARVRDFDSIGLSLPAKVFRNLARMRWKHRFFSIPIDWHIAALGQKALKKSAIM